MYELAKIHQILTEQVENGELTIEQASEAFDTMYEDVTSNVALDIVNAYIEDVITEEEYDTYMNIILEAVNGDKLSKKEEKKADKEISNLPKNEKKDVEDSIKKASKEVDTAKKNMHAIDGVNKIISSKKSAKKAVKESEDALDIDKELALYETTAADARYLLHKTQREYKDAIKDCNEHIKDKKYDKALNDIKICKKLCSQMSDEVKDLDSNIGGVIVSGICEGLITSLKATGVGLGVGIATQNSDLASGASGAMVLIETIKVLYGIVKSIDKKGDISVSDFNATKAKVIASIDTMNKMLDRKEAQINSLKEKK